jgi:hypothetical protein
LDDCFLKQGTIFPVAVRTDKTLSLSAFPREICLSCLKPVSSWLQASTLSTTLNNGPSCNEQSCFVLPLEGRSFYIQVPRKCVANSTIFSVAAKWYKHFAMDASRSVSLQISLMTVFPIPYFLYSKAGLRRFEGDLGGTMRSNITPCTVSWRKGWVGFKLPSK